MANSIRAFSVLGMGAAIAFGIAWTSGELQRFGLASPFMLSAAPVDAAPATAKTELSELTKAADAPANPVVDQATLAPTRIPAFDIVRVQPDGSMVIAGRSAPGAAIDIMAGERVIGKTNTDESGSFAFVLDQPLPPGDYNISLIAKVNGETLTSEEKAIIQIPQQPGGDVLAIVTAPDSAPEVLAAGSASTAPDSMAGGATATPAVSPDDKTAPIIEPAPDAVVSADPAVPVVVTGEAAPETALRIEAIEIDGTKTFIAGSAPAGANVRLYLGETLIGDAKAGEEGRFLVETTQSVAAESQMLRADMINAEGQVVARASVPFERVDGANPAVAGGAGATSQLTAAAAGEAQPAVSGDASATATPGATAPALALTDASVIIRKGDTLWQIARRVYGRGVTFSTIYNANIGQITDPDRIFPGQVFTVPRSTESGETADFEAIKG